MKVILFLLISSCIIGQTPKEQIIKTLDNWHLAASQARFEDYMNAMTNDAVYIGTDATENWNKTEFMAFAKPYFDKGKAWSFTALERHIYFSKDQKTAWFDELLNTQMKICRGSGVLVKIGKEWKIQHYVLSMTIPNNNSSEVIKTKTTIEDKLIDKLSKR
jgi:SnoaL-like domain